MRMVPSQRGNSRMQAVDGEIRDLALKFIRLRGLQRVNRVRLLLALGGGFDAMRATTVQSIP
jgi:hypothetical protein